MAISQGTRIYDNEYFAGAQMFLYIGDCWIDEVTSLQYMTQQNKTPIYGYASQLWDDCAAGQVVVQGAFSINYTESGYLWAVLQRYNRMFRVPQGEQTTRIKESSSSNIYETTVIAKRNPKKQQDKPVVGSNVNQTLRANIQRILQGDASRGELYQFYHDLAGNATFDVKNPKDKAYEDVVEAFEDEVWAEGATNESLLSQNRRTDDNIFDGFDLYVVFGNYASPGANHTVQKIVDVRLTSQAKQIMIDGRPIQEEYTFIAKSVV